MPNDTHAMNVHLALKKLGHESKLWYTADFPSQQTHSFEIKNNDISWNARGSDLEIRNEDFDVVWYRRPRKPVLPNTIHPEDQHNALQENILFFQTFWNTIAPNATWINPYKKCIFQYLIRIFQTSNDPSFYI